MLLALLELQSEENHFIDSPEFGDLQYGNDSDGPYVPARASSPIVTTIFLPRGPQKRRFV